MYIKIVDCKNKTWEKCQADINMEIGALSMTKHPDDEDLQLEIKDIRFYEQAMIVIILWKFEY